MIVGLDGLVLIPKHAGGPAEFLRSFESFAGLLVVVESVVAGTEVKPGVHVLGVLRGFELVKFNRVLVHRGVVPVRADDCLDKRFL